MVAASAPIPAPPHQNDPGILKSWPRSAQWVLAFLFGAAATLLAIHGLGYTRCGSRPAELEPGQAPAYRIDLNRARHAELLQLPGVGENLARRIETYRQEHGGFRSVEELAQVHGVGPATMSRLRPWVCVADELEETAPAQTILKLAASTKKKVGKKADSIKEPIDVNRASAAELQRLPGVGPALSGRIIEARTKRPFQTVDDLTRVSGIKQKMLEKIRPYIKVVPENEDKPKKGNLRASRWNAGASGFSARPC